MAPDHLRHVLALANKATGTDPHGQGHGSRVMMGGQHQDLATGKLDPQGADQRYAIHLVGAQGEIQQQQVSRSADQAGEQVAAFFINANHVKVGLGRQGVGEPMPNNSVVVQ